MDLKWWYSITRNVHRPSVVIWLYRIEITFYFPRHEHSLSYECANQLWDVPGSPWWYSAILWESLEMPSWFRSHPSHLVCPQVHPCPRACWFWLWHHLYWGISSLVGSISLYKPVLQDGELKSGYFQQLFGDSNPRIVLHISVLPTVFAACESVVISFQNSWFSSNSCILPILQWGTLQSDYQPAPPI